MGKVKIMETKEIKNILRKTLSKNLVLDLDDAFRAVALKAHKMINEHANLDAKRARPLEGLARFRMSEKAFEETCKQHGGYSLEDGFMPNSNLKVFQPFMRFVNDSGIGVILGFASMSDSKELPSKNKSRLAGVSVNYNLSLRLDLDEHMPQAGDIFALFLSAKDKLNAGYLTEMAVGVVDADYQDFLFYEPLDKFLADEIVDDVDENSKYVKSKVKLKKNIVPYVPSEIPEWDKEGTKG